MNRPVGPEVIAAPVDTGLRALVGIAGYYRIAADPHQIERELALNGRLSNEDDLVRAARLIGLKARDSLEAAPQHPDPGDPAAQ
jgi:ABC-type bacteriocin/lantibiotic exporter with double-glycine peptidase domain